MLKYNALNLKCVLPYTIWRIISEVFILKLALAILSLILSLVLVLIVLFQQGRRDGLSGAISGAADTFLSKNKARSLDAKLAKLTTWVAAAFIIVTLALNLRFFA